MAKDLLFTCIVFLWTQMVLHSTSAKPVSRREDISASIVRSGSDAFRYLSEYGFNPCEHQNGSQITDGKPATCLITLESMLKNFQRAYKLPITGKLDQQTSKLMNTPRCGIKDLPLAFNAVTSW